MTPSSTPNLTRARHSASRLLQALAVSVPEDIVVEDLAMSRGVFVFEEKLEGADARLIRKGSKGLIRVKADLPEVGRKRFAIAHDLGHWELHAHVSQWNLCTESDTVAYGGSPPEVEANAFAAELLMPTRLMRPRCADATPDLMFIQALASEFRTTLTATAVRFVEECRETCVAVFSSDRRVQWWRTREGRPVWIESGHPIDPRSQAWNPSPGIKMEKVPTEAWFPEQTRGRAYDLFEQSVSLGRYGTVLALLWLIERGDEEDDSHWTRSLR